jgi:hypothetical protein
VPEEFKQNHARPNKTNRQTRHSRGKMLKRGMIRHNQPISLGICALPYSSLHLRTGSHANTLDS